jgi:hypothetical protein
MKKAIVILLMVLYSASTIGATINMHYCMNKFAGWSLISKKKDKCPKCGMTNTGCCKDEKKQIKLSLDQQKSEYNHINYDRFLVVSTVTFYNANASCIKIVKHNFTYLHGPPILLGQDTQATLSTFLI